MSATASAQAPDRHPAITAEHIIKPVGDYDVAHWHRLHRLIADVSLPLNFRLAIGQDPVADGGKFFVQVVAQRIDIVTGEPGEGRGGKARPSVHACDSEIVGAAFGLYKSYVEHEARETFKYRGRRVFGPHIDVFALWEAAAATHDPHARRSLLTSEQMPRMMALASDVSLPGTLRLVVGQDPVERGGDWWMQVVDDSCTIVASDRVHPVPGVPTTKLLDTAFGLYRAMVEDEARRTFWFRDRAIYSPDVDVERLHDIATRVDVRPPATSGATA